MLRFQVLERTIGDNMSDTELILEEIRALRKDVRDDMSKAWDAIEEQRKCSTQIKIRQAEISGDIKRLKLEKRIGDETFIRHVENKEKHFNPYHNETYWKKMSRKKPEIATSITLGGILFGFLLALFNYFGVI